MNLAAKSYAGSKGKEVILPKWEEIEIIDHGRDIITAIMRVNCQYAYEFRPSKDSIASDLEKLKALLDSGALSQSEYEAAKHRVLFGTK